MSTPCRWKCAISSIRLERLQCSHTTPSPHCSIVGSTGYIGTGAANALSSDGRFAVTATVRNPDSDKAASLKDLTNVKLAAGDMSDPASLSEPLTGARVAFIVTPGAEDRAALATNAVKAAKDAGVPHVVVVSVTSADDDSVLFGRQFMELEANVKAAGIKYTLLRLPLFTDNNWAQAGSIKGDGKFYGPADPAVKFSSVAVSDVAACVTAIVADPGAHEDKTYVLTSPAYTHAELAAAFSASLGKPVEYVQVPDEAAKKSFMDIGMPEWQAGGVLELYAIINAGRGVYDSDIKAITGADPLTIEAWVESVKGGFQ